MMPNNKDMPDNEKINESIFRMNDLLQRKLSILREIYLYSLQTSSYISEDSVEQLNNIFDEKREMTLEVDSLDRQFLNEFDRLKADYGLNVAGDAQGGKSPYLRELKDSTAEMLELLKKTEELDAISYRSIKSLRDNISNDLTNIRRQKHVSGVYGNEGSRALSRGADMGAPAGFEAKN